MQQTQLQLSLFRNQMDTSAVFLRISLMSHRKQGLLSQRDIKIGNGEQLKSKSLIREIQITAGALAEYQCETYGDRHNPEQCAREAVEAYNEIIQKVEDAQLEKSQLQTQETLNG